MAMGLKALDYFGLFLKKRLTFLRLAIYSVFADEQIGMFFELPS
jgi:hypothetical protein